MVRHHHLHPQFPGPGNLRLGRNAVVAGDNQTHPIGMGFLNQSVIQPVPVPDPVRNGGIYPPPHVPQSPGKDIGGTYAVHIIIPDDPDFHIAGHIVPKQAHRFLHAFQQPGAVTIRQGASQELPHLFRLRNIPVPNNPGQHRADAELPCPTLKIRLFGSYHPLFHPVFFPPLLFHGKEFISPVS